jgi:type III secretion protein C
VLGNLFKSRSRSRGRIERLFLISPRVVDVGTNASTASMQVPAEAVRPVASAPLVPGTRSATPPTAPVTGSTSRP